ncbi:hypothetical protein CEUSTIGMA_g12705.t1 [Chlamydomonas eustigma]|uniref:SEA domain-containing protein n=1 Tax=Chlamydomonas eustigma TaxID=1157962 RepID=A0A250XQF0_9CHLO|nr:hypothetical protein CEUSTIGMA_g12705.t1 [Chlamydomonas eustigma]|eukprot:GAX85288.1 hypothetical protein CEUSTIGMA_g12705.t1 [Chlamydomonas eustigma]
MLSSSTISPSHPLPPAYSSPQFPLSTSSFPPPFSALLPQISNVLPPSPNVTEEPPTVSSGTILEQVTYTFAMDYSTLSSNQSALATFKSSIISSVASAAYVPSNFVTVTSISPGSVAATMVISIPSNFGLSFSQANVIATNLASNVAVTFNCSFLSTFGITAVTATAQTSSNSGFNSSSSDSHVLSASVSSSSSSGAPVGLIVGVVVGGGLLVMTVTGVAITLRFLMKKKVVVSPVVHGL